MFTVNVVKTIELQQVLDKLFEGTHSVEKNLEEEFKEHLVDSDIAIGGGATEVLISRTKLREVMEEDERFEPKVSQLDTLLSGVGEEVLIACGSGF